MGFIGVTLYIFWIANQLLVVTHLDKRRGMSKHFSWSLWPKGSVYPSVGVVVSHLLTTVVCRTVAMFSTVMGSSSQMFVGNLVDLGF